MDTTLLHLFLASTVLLSGSIYILYRTTRLWSITMLDVALWMVSVFFGVGPWISFFYSGFDLPDFDSAALFKAYVAILFYLFGMWVVRQLASRHPALVTETGTVQVLGRVPEVIRNAATITFAAVAVAFIFVQGVRAVLFLKYGMLYSGTASLEREIALPYSWTVARSLSRVVAAGLTIWGTTAIWMRGSMRTVALVVVASEALYAFTQGRRNLLLFTITIFLTLLIVRGKLMLRHILAMGVVLYLLWTIVMPAFFMIRSNLLSASTRDNFAIQMLEAITDYMSGTQEYRQMQHYQRNLGSRPLIINFAVRILEDQKAMPIMAGQAMGRSLLLALPRIAPVDKSIMTEQAIQRFYSMSEVDTSINWPATAVADFGVLGGFLYGIVFATSFMLMEIFASALRASFPLVAICVVGILLESAFMVEQPPEALWGNIRGCLIIFLAAIVLSWIAPPREQEGTVTYYPDAPT